jgi:hypothetical protein
LVDWWAAEKEEWKVYMKVVKREYKLVSQKVVY